MSGRGVSQSGPVCDSNASSGCPVATAASSTVPDSP